VVLGRKAGDLGRRTDVAGGFDGGDRRFVESARRVAEVLHRDAVFAPQDLPRAGDFFFQVWLYGGFAIGGTLLGYWVAMLFGRDYRSRSLKAYSETRAAKPRKAVRR